MAFSIFKKNPKDTRKPSAGRGRSAGSPARTGGGSEVVTRPVAKPLGRPLSGPSTRFPSRPGANTAGPASGPHAEQDRVRDNARLTAAKIDAIEAEMTRDLMGGASPQTRAATAPADTITKTTVIISPTTIAPTTTAKFEKTQIEEEEEANAELLAGDIDAIEINTASGGAVIDESAILFSNGQTEGAEAALRAGLNRDDLGSATRLAWLMLFEIVNQRGDRNAYEQLKMHYVLRFESSPPAWIDYSDPLNGRSAAAPPAPVVGAVNCVRLPPVIDAGIVAHLEELRGLTASHATVQLDVSDAKGVDIAGAGLLLRVISAFKRSQRELTLVGASALAEALYLAVESGRRDPSDALWMLLLDVLRMLNRLDEFEETAIQYCITFEVSPPSWEPPLPNLKVAPPTPPPAAAVETASGGSPLELRGTVDGEGEPHFGRLVAAARERKQVVIDCSHLRRLSFSAGSALLGTLRKIRQSGATIEIRQASALVAALLHLLGVSAVATVHSRYA